MRDNGKMVELLNMIFPAPDNCSKQNAGFSRIFLATRDSFSYHYATSSDKSDLGNGVGVVLKNFA